jgi:hypothetical protein
MKNRFKDEGWKYKGGTGLWREYENVKTGESTIKSLGKIPEMKDLLDPNCDCYYELTDPHGSSVQCQKCGRGKTLVWGLQFLRNGKIIENLKS